MTHTSVAIVLPKCIHCGNHHDGACYRVKSIEYHENGTVKRVEYHGFAPLLPPIQPIPWPPPLPWENGPTCSVEINPAEVVLLTESPTCVR